ncbi:molybdopterin-guanine dinucleotide biosynthesis protein B [Oikeobacillus pervagus]|uniref:Molybdopterin-guanine dinucleotide biosynthesis protein B n=1 Tax=Oikeobacillus pervagus TaxID=1325931 RepID=A0AAJ1WLP8_9BACI|nr:molybdopterin-guanine dinucleotide biosynthesis protein B [Oikeobacillus pervagus]MDQ0216436.1 molybdopterin-guanine dinucleotide biosynthesis protein B [Oikeobacillus pervagus]
MARKQKIFQVVGYQNSGKTTLIQYIIKSAKAHNIAVGTIKHHGHGGLPYIGDEGKDTSTHRENGAIATAVEGEGIVNIVATIEQPSIQNILSIYKLLPIDFILIEGYKQHPFPKVVLIREEVDLILLNQLKNIQAVISDVDLKHLKLSVPVFLRKEKAPFTNWLWGTQYI